MTGRFFREAIHWEDYRAVLDVRPPPGIAPPEPRYNIPPMSWVPVIREREFNAGGLEVALKLWSLVPQWWHRPLGEKKWSSFTAQCETIDESPTFRGAFRYRRCLVPASGFFVWSGAQGRKTPYAIALNDTPWFCFAGVWERAMIDGSEFDTFAILTTAANDLMSAHGARMPVILRPEDYGTWLDTKAPEQPLFDPFPSIEMHEWPVGDAVGNVRNQGPELLER